MHRGLGNATGPQPHNRHRSWGWHSQQLAQRCQHALQQHLRVLGPHARLLSMGFSTATMAAAAGSALPAPGEGQHTSEQPSVQQRARTWQDFGHETRRATDTLLVINCLAFALQWLSKDLLTFWGAKVNALIAAGQVWRLITPAFLHSSMFHLLINCHALHSIGPHLELVSGGPRLAAVYMTSAFTGTLASYLLTPSPSLGASGALFGCGAALALFYWRHKEVLQQHSDKMLRSLGVTVAINLGYSLLARNVDNWGHLGGALGGALVAWTLGPQFVRHKDGRFTDQPPVPWLAYADPRSMRPASALLLRAGKQGTKPTAKGTGGDVQQDQGQKKRKGRWGRKKEAVAEEQANSISSINSNIS